MLAWQVRGGSTSYTLFTPAKLAIYWASTQHLFPSTWTLMSICPRVLTTLIPVSHLGSQGGGGGWAVLVTQAVLSFFHTLPYCWMKNTPILVYWIPNYWKRSHSTNVIKVQSANKLHGSLHPRNHLNRISQHFKIIIGNNWCLKHQTFLFTWVLRALWGCLRCINSLL